MKSRSTDVPILLAALLLAGCCPCRTKRPSPTIVVKEADARLDKVTFSGLGEYAGGRLFDYMNGAAEAYYKHAFEVLAAADAKQGECEARLEVYKVATTGNAKALFDEHNDGKGKELPAGVASAAWYARELEGIFYRGPYFCRVLVYGDDKASQAFLDTLAAAVDQAIPQ